MVGLGERRFGGGRGGGGERGWWIGSMKADLTGLEEYGFLCTFLHGHVVNMPVKFEGGIRLGRL